MTHLDTALRHAMSRAVMNALVELLFLAAASGCATIVSGTTQRIRFESTPPGATVHVDGKTYTTPTGVVLSRSKNYDVEFEADEHIPATRQVTRDTNGWVFGNILIGGIIGLLVDYSTGAANDLKPELVSVDLVRKPPTVAAPQDAAGELAPNPAAPAPPAGPAPPPGS